MKKSILCMLMISLGLNVNAQTDAEMVRSTVVKSDIESHIYFLASDELKGRQTGSDELKIAASYLANHLRKYGVKPAGDNDTYYQNVPFEKVSAPASIHFKANDFSSEKFLAMSVKNIDFNGDAVYLGYGTKEDFAATDVKGKLIIVKAGTAETKDMRSQYRAGRAKKEMAQAAEAAGLVELVEVDENLWSRYAHYFNEDKTGLKNPEKDEKFLHIWIGDKGLTGAASIESAKNLDVELKIEGITSEEFFSRNVVGYLEGTDPKLKDEFIIYSAHYDHIGIGKPDAQNDSIYNGARDNAVGTVTVLSAAENLGKYPTKRSSLFILFTGEEKGLLGSKYYAENPVMPLHNMVYCFNSDNGGYNDTSKVTIFGLNRTTVAPHIIAGAKEFGLEVIDDPAPEQNLFDRSDNVNFAKKGVPAPTYSMGFTAFDEEINKTYHQTADNPETVDFDYLEKFFRSYVLSCRMISNDPVTPFWTEGDKYYDAGVELYKEKTEEASVLD
ncbi:M28 family peptidase [Lutimonas sp.]|uniref:M28 family peptidase n=1 Tax=Lutimonas sp. TaxID=1872403 RepID=UPI003D9AD619